MDNFIDKLAQKFTAGEVIRANSAAEERELKKLREQVSEYDRCLQEMRKLQLHNTESVQKLKQQLEENRKGMERLLQTSLAKIEAASAVDASELTNGLQEQLSSLAESESNLKEQLSGLAENENNLKERLSGLAENESDLKERLSGLEENINSVTASLETNQKEISEWFKQADDFLHKENVKVYRNVQAVVVEELGAKTETVLAGQETSAKKAVKPVLVFALLAFLTAAATLVIQVMSLMGML
jgi:chromosome segregation ATPase